MTHPDSEAILALIQPRLGTRQDGKPSLDCAVAFELADAHGLELFDIARVCNQQGIKIARCQLGCFK